MFTIFRALRGLVKKTKEPVTIDGTVFRFHCIITAVLLLGCSVIITATHYVGTPIECLVSGIPAHAVNTYCWITSTFTMPSAFYKQIGHEIPHPGVDTDYGDEDDKKYQSYYQWVCFVLFFQGLACYTPKWMWDNWEGGLMCTLLMGTNHHIIVREERKKKKEILLIYLIDHIKRHRLYAVRYWLCELLCLINVLLQLYSMNVFFAGEFYDYGLRVIKMIDEDQENRIDPMVSIFPRVTKCTFQKYGPTGTIQKHDSLCVLPLNIVNEKTYLVIWFWFVFLAVLLSILVLYRLSLILIPALRPKVLQVKRKIASTKEAEIVTQNLDVGDWWVLYMLGENLDPLIYNEILVDLAKKFDDSDDSTLKIR